MKNPLVILLAFLFLTAAGGTLAVITQQQNSFQPKPEGQFGAPITGASLISTAIPSGNALAEAVFIEDSHSFGEVKYEVPASHTFRFKNTGTEALTIEKVKPSCGCTASDYTREPIQPGEEGFVELTFNAKKIGIFRKSATVTMNTEPSNKVLSISGEVVE